MLMPCLQGKALMNSLCFENPPFASLRVPSVTDPLLSQKFCSSLLLPLLGQNNVLLSKQLLNALDQMHTSGKSY